jgi:hypothetical protein
MTRTRTDDMRDLNVGRHGGRREAWHLGGQEGVGTALDLHPDGGGPVVAILTNLEPLGATLLPVARQNCRPRGRQPRRRAVTFA